MSTRKRYDTDYKINAVKLAKEIGSKKAAEELGISKNTIYGWMSAAKQGRLNLGKGTLNPESALSLTEERSALRQTIKEQNKKIKRLEELNDFLEEASVFFAASRQKSVKM